MRDVTVVLDDRAILRRVHLDVGSGLTVLRGPNGAGKTTLLRALLGLVPLARGSCALTIPALYIGHRPQLLRGLTARENLTFFLRYRADGRLDPSRALDALALWGLAEDADRPVERLSAGQRRRAALARLDSEVGTFALLDEPFAELDAAGRALLRDRIRARVSEGGAVLVATHAHEELDRDAASVHHLANGTITSLPIRT
jgi:heme exporter protein A